MEGRIENRTTGANRSIQGTTSSQYNRVLQMLREAGEYGVSTSEFIRAYIPRFSAVILLLRRDGYQVTTSREKASSFRYRLEGTGRGWRFTNRTLETSFRPVQSRLPLQVVTPTAKYEQGRLF